MTHAVPTKRTPSRSPRRRRFLLGLTLGVLLLAGLVALAVPLLGIRASAEETRAELGTALEAMRSGDLRTARESVAQARASIADATDRADSVGADVWSVLPVAGTAVDDVRHLVSALDDATSVAEISLDLYPKVAGKQATLFEDERLDLGTLASVLSGVREAGDHLLAADAALDEVSGSTPFLGATIDARRDEAVAQISSAADNYRGLEPMLDHLPAVFGADGARRYLVAMLNPAELRYSGGATLAFAPMTWDDGRVELGESINLDGNPRFFNPIEWRRVRGNPFHGDGPVRLRNATFPPSWSVAGEELLRAWKSATGEGYDGVLAVDVVTLSRLFGVTGGVEVPGYGTLTEDNLVETLIGSYDDFYPDPSAQDPLSAGIIPAFKDQLFSGGDYVKKAQTLETAADGRHLALYFRDPEVQEGFAALGLTGDLTTPDGDYLGVFTQNTNGSKVDFWQRRRVEDVITIDENGSARHRLGVTIDNATPPYVAPVPDPRFGYFTRWSGLFLGTFLPPETEVREASWNGEPWEGRVRGFRDHGFIVQQALMEPTSRGEFSARYRVPDAVETDGESLTYRLAVDPQGLVVPESLDLRVRVPDGYTITSVPEGWTIEDGVARYSTVGLDASQEWQIVAERDT